MIVLTDADNSVDKIQPLYDIKNLPNLTKCNPLMILKRKGLTKLGIEGNFFNLILKCL